MEYAKQRNNKRALYPILVVLSIVLTINLVAAGPAGFGKIKLDTDVSGFNGPDGVWVFNWIDSGGTADKVRATFDPSDFKADTGKETKGDFEISIDGTSNKCQYDIKREAERIDVFTVNVVTEEYTDWTWNVDSKQEQDTLRDSLINKHNCLKLTYYTNGVPGAFIIEQQLTLVRARIGFVCFQKNSEIGKIGTLRGPTYITETSWKLEAEGKSPITKVVSNADAGEGKSTDLGSNAKIQWEGQLSSGQTCPVGDNEYMLHTGSTWKMIDRANYHTYENYMKNNLDTLANEVACYEGLNPSSCLGRSKSAAEQMINTRVTSAAQTRSFSNFNINIISSSISNGRLEIALDRLIRFPMFRIFVDSDYLELAIPTGKPKLICGSGTTEFNAGEPGKISIVAKNIGQGEGGFNIRIKNCDSGFSAGDTESFTLKAGASKTITLQTEASVPDSEFSGKCTIELKESFTNEVDTCQVNLKALPLRGCTEGEQYCGFNDKGKPAVLKCENNEKKVVEVCSEKCSFKQDGVPYCATGDGDDEEHLDCAWYENEVVIESTDCGFLGVKKLWGGCVKLEKTECRVKSSFILVAVLITMIAIIGLLIFALPKQPKKKLNGRK